MSMSKRAQSSDTAILLALWLFGCSSPSAAVLLIAQPTTVDPMSNDLPANSVGPKNVPTPSAPPSTATSGAGQGSERTAKSTLTSVASTANQILFKV